jgi:hypothetical protein
MAGPERSATTQRTGRARRTLEDLDRRLAESANYRATCDARAPRMLAATMERRAAERSELVLQPSSLAPRILIEAANAQAQRSAAWMPRNEGTLSFRLALRTHRHLEPSPKLPPRVRCSLLLGGSIEIAFRRCRSIRRRNCPLV